VSESGGARVRRMARGTADACSLVACRTRRRTRLESATGGAHEHVLELGHLPSLALVLGLPPYRS
jgi:hypothetical protein